MNEQVRMKIESIRREYPLIARALDRVLPALSREEARYVETVYALLDVHDLSSVTVEEILEYVRALLLARKELGYTAAVPEELFVPYVLYPRVNNEYLDGSREWLFQQLAERVKGKSLLDAALEVNLWCCEQATYQSTDDRTIGPMGMCRRAFGRCGEESTLAVAALRSAGIPARQVYSPRWAHCDDNHAWVEFWAEDGWHYMGACEPEPVADEGWFISAASRAMLVRAIAPDPSEVGYQVVNTLSRYADTVELTVHLTVEGKSVPDVPVSFRLINDSRLHTIYPCKTNAGGKAVFETGFGSLVVSAYHHGRLMEKLVDTREEREVTLRWEDGFDPLHEERQMCWQLRPPMEKVPAPHAADADHQARLRRCEELRGSKVSSYSQGNSTWLQKARGNRAEIERFLSLEDFHMEDKEAILGTLTDKDFADVTCAALTDALAVALPHKGSFKKLVWENWVLSPRVEHEMLLPIRQELKKGLEGAGLLTGEDVLAWMEKHLRPLEEYGLTDRRGNAAGYIRNGVCPKSEWDIVAVQLCRALGIPAFINTDNGRIMLVASDKAYTPGLEGDPVCLRLENAEDPVMYREHFTLAQWTGEEYRTLELPAHELAEHCNFHLQPGSYRLTTNRRQIDGAASAWVFSFLLREDRAVKLVLEADETADKLKKEMLPAVKLKSLTRADIELPEAGTGVPHLLIFAQPGAEPTEHLLLELLELQEAYREGGWPVRFLLFRPEMAENATLRKVLEALPESGCFLYEDADRYAIQRAMGVGDYRLPLAVAVDGEGCGVYACANYNIRSAHTLLKILKML